VLCLTVWCLSGKAGRSTHAVSPSGEDAAAAQQAATPEGTAAAAAAAAGTQVSPGVPGQGQETHSSTTMLLQAASPADKSAARVEEEAAPGSVQQQPRQSASKRRGPATALSRLAKLIRSSPGITPTQHASAGSAQQAQCTPAVPAAGAHMPIAEAYRPSVSSDIARQQYLDQQMPQLLQDDALLAEQTCQEDVGVRQAAALGSGGPQETADQATTAAGAVEPAKSYQGLPSCSLWLTAFLRSMMAA